MRRRPGRDRARRAAAHDRGGSSASRRGPGIGSARQLRAGPRDRTGDPLRRAVPDPRHLPDGPPDGCARARPSGRPRRGRGADRRRRPPAATASAPIGSCAPTARSAGCVSHAGRAAPPRSNIVAGTMLDVTDRHEAELLLAHQATHDWLTGLPNSASLHSTLLDALATAECAHRGWPSPCSTSTTSS